AAGLAHGPNRLVEVRDVPEDDLRALGGQHPGRGQPDPTSRARHQRHFAGNPPRSRCHHPSLIPAGRRPTSLRTPYPELASTVPCREIRSVLTMPVTNEHPREEKPMIDDGSWRLESSVPTGVREALGIHGAVASGHPVAAAIGASVLQTGGNAVDAAIAVAA